MSDARDILEQLLAWRDAGHGAALATVVATWGSSPRPVGSLLAVADDGRFVGSVSGGCVEAAVIDAARGVIASGRPRRLEFGVSDAEAWAVGLACGGRIEVFVEPVT
jgi:xanthine/CO dehydrogenase XdhC/CoxF family maturation factor